MQWDQKNLKSEEVEVMTPPPSWSSVLQGIIKSTAERQRLISVLGVTHMTLSRWASGESKPSKSHLIHLLQVLRSDQRRELLDALKPQFPEIHSWLTEDTSSQIPAEFFPQVLNIRTTTAEKLLFWRICDIVLKQALTQLDPNNLGMAIKLVQCMPPSPQDHKIHSLRERVGRGTPPWMADLEYDVLFLGLEALAGYAVEVGHIVSEGNLSKGMQTNPSYPDIYEVSAAAHPIRLEGRVAGCLLASSTQPAYFTQQRLNLLIAYSDLIALAFDRKEFYPLSMLKLRVMPQPEVQRPIIANFRQRVTAKFQQASLQQQHCSNAEIEMLAWQEIEEELLSIRDDR
jgi:transcriptional regulator with XRE-family HTH domain